jgi:molybdate transport system substrate-binding protein
MRLLAIFLLATVSILAGFHRPAAAVEATVAVATNFVPPLRILVERYEAESGHRLKVVPGSTGKLYAQITHGAPFDVFLAADEERPRRLEADGLGGAGSRFTYAEGRLVLIRAGGGPVEFNRLMDGGFRKLALANPKLAPYGLAAEQALRHAGVWDRVAARLVYGENIGQAYTLVATGNADAGLVALSQVKGMADPPSYWLVPSDWHQAIRQDAVLVKRGEGNPAAEDFLAFLRSGPAREIIRDFGYGTP